MTVATRHTNSPADPSTADGLDERNHNSVDLNDPFDERGNAWAFVASKGNTDILDYFLSNPETDLECDPTECQRALNSAVLQKRSDTVHFFLYCETDKSFLWPFL